MVCEPGIERSESARPDGPEPDDELEMLLDRLPIPPGIKSADEGDWEEELAQADADLAAGRFYPHAIVSAWLATWGDPDYKLFDEWLQSSG
jgi:hypothetical protein